MIKQNQTYLNRLHVVMDAVCIYLAGYVAYYIRFKLNIHGFWLNKEIFEYNRYYKEFYQYQQPLIASLIFLLLLYSFFGLYTPKRYQRGSKELVFDIGIASPPDLKFFGLFDRIFVPLMREDLNSFEYQRFKKQMRKHGVWTQTSWEEAMLESWENKWGRGQWP